MNDILYRRLLYFLTPQFDIYEHIAEQIAVAEKVVDIGFGTGFGALYIKDKTGANVTGVELDTDAVKFADKCMPGVRWAWGDIVRGIGHVGKNFDTALMIEVLEHVEDWQLALRYTNDILKVGGRLIISARNSNAQLRKNDLHEREWTADDFVKALKKYFDHVELYDYTLKELQDINSMQTPLIAVAKKKKNA